VLQDAGIKLTSVASHTYSKSARAMLEALLSGVTDPEQLAELAKAPALVGFTVQVTAPDGVPTVPGLVSVTVAVHVVATPRSVGFGEHTTTVAVVR